MGSYEEERDAKCSGFGKILKINTCIACFASFLVSMAGGFILLWWKLNYHHSNSQLWMVPFGLILFVTPVFVVFSAFISEICNPREFSSLNQPVILSPDNSVRDPER
ncbi:hypothetical protein NMG60_11028860 [Bertholletia excelsa]